MRRSVPTRLVTTGILEFLGCSKSGAFGFYDAVGDFCDFEDGVNFWRDAFQLVVLFQFVDELAEIFVRHFGSLVLVLTL
jgi:hypothetical protein